MKNGEMLELSQHNPGPRGHGCSRLPGLLATLLPSEAGMQCFDPCSLGSLMISCVCQHSHPILCPLVLVNFCSW